MAKLILIILLAVTPYTVNGYKLSNCDFESDYKCEIIHGIGVILPPTALVTMWFGSDS